MHKIHRGLAFGICVEVLRSTPPKKKLPYHQALLTVLTLLSGISASRQVFGLRHLKAGLA